MNRHEYQTLNAEEQAKVFFESPFKDRAELLLYSQEPLSLTQALSPEEVYLVTREMDPEERSEIVSFANTPQLLFISDIDCWKEDQIDPDGFREWLETLLKAGEAKLISWLVQVDPEMVVTGFQKLVHVLKPEWEYRHEEDFADRAYFSLDQYYFVYVKQENLALVKQVLACIFERNHHFYVSILEGILTELEGELEEIAFHSRQVRLSERGFPDPEAAHNIYRPISKSEFDEFPLKVEKDHEGERYGDARQPLPDYPMLWSAERLFIDDLFVLLQDKPGVLEGLREEFVWLSNKAIACDGIHFASEERVRKGIQRVRQLVNIGVQDLSGEDAPLACEIIQTRWLEIILRWGVTHLLEARDSVEDIMEKYWEGNTKALLEFLELPYDHVFRGLLKPVPVFYDRTVVEEVHQLRDFKNIQELENAQSLVRDIQNIHVCLFRQYPRIFSDLHIKHKMGYSNITLPVLLGTLFANFVLNHKKGLTALSEKELSRFLQTAFNLEKSRWSLNPNLKEQFLNTFMSTKERKSLNHLWNRVFQNMEGELGELDRSHKPDPRFISCLYLRTK